MVTELDWTSLLRFIDENDDFLVTSHINPDADAVGSALAAARLLQRYGKRAQVILPDAPVSALSVFYAPGEIIAFQPETTDVSGFCALFVVDVSSWDRLGALGEALRDENIPRACIDHHPPTELFCTIEVRDVEASATGVLMYEMAQQLHIELTPRIAEAIYLGIMFDTQCFRLPNTNAAAHRAAATCIERGVKPAEVYAPVFGMYPKKKLDLLAAALPTLRLYAGGKVAVLYTTQEMYSENGASGEEDEGLIEFPRSIEGVEVAVFARERDDGTVKVSWRSRDKFEIRTSAVHFGGGGHARAAGATIPGRIDTVLPAVVNELVTRLFGKDSL